MLRRLWRRLKGMIMGAVDRSMGGVGQPANSAFMIIPSDTLDLPYVTRAVYVGATGNLHVTMLNGEDVTFLGVPAGSFLPLRVIKVWFSNTTAQNILGMY